MQMERVHENALQKINAGGVQFVEGLEQAKKYGALTAPSVKLFVAGRHFRLPVVRADHSRDVCACSRVDFFVEARARLRGCGPFLCMSWISRTLRP